MKRLLFVLCLGISCLVSAQEYTTNWPYLFSEFQPGTVFYKDGGKSSLQLNIHLLKSHLHFLKGEQIMEAEPGKIDRVEINGANYLEIDGRIIRLLKAKEVGFVGELVLGDFESLFDKGGAYGASSNAQSVQKMSSLEIGGISNMNHMFLKESKDGGKALSAIREYMLIVKGECYPASKKDIEKKLSTEQRVSFKNFLKKHKIKWKDVDSLYELLDFFKDEMPQ